MRHQKRPYFPLIVFLTLVAFGVFLAWQTSVLSKELANPTPTRAELTPTPVGPIPQKAEQRFLFLPVMGKGTCQGASCSSGEQTLPATPGIPALPESSPTLLLLQPLPHPV